MISLCVVFSLPKEKRVKNFRVWPLVKDLSMSPPNKEIFTPFLMSMGFKLQPIYFVFGETA